MAGSGQFTGCPHFIFVAETGFVSSPSVMSYPGDREIRADFDVYYEVSQEAQLANPRNLTEPPPREFGKPVSPARREPAAPLSYLTFIR